MSKKTTKQTTPFGNRFLEDARDTHQRVSVHFVNGFQLKGEVVTFAVLEPPPTLRPR